MPKKPSNTVKPIDKTPTPAEPIAESTPPAKKSKEAPKVEKTSSACFSGRW